MIATQANKDLVRSMIDQVWSGGRPERLREFWVDETRAEADGLHQMLTEPERCRPVALDAARMVNSP